ncbi:MAG: hypothetical protein A2297_04090 [Elusimicrobia bacterium RIFOXYB2_FULL_48_7]|nr:MAG: hypothetical protein A2297_04090 [Elusimicrobia bacterium RIFOXYB2_FULL_48_7]
MKQMTELQFDAVKEICATCMANAATAISKMVNQKINMSVPEMKIVPLNEVSSNICRCSELVAGIYCRLQGDFSGGFLLTLPRKTSMVLSDVLLNKKQGKTNMLGNMEKSALTEFGNIIIGTFVNYLAKSTDKYIYISVPSLAYDIVDAIIDNILIELAAETEYALVMKMYFNDVSDNICGQFFLIPDQNSLKLLLSAVDKKIGEFK